ncbi:MAG: ribonuclease D [Rhodospirillales bacterium]
MKGRKKSRLPTTPTVITTTEALRSFVEDARTAPYITIDTEFMRENTYWPILCLIQVAIGGREMDDPKTSAVIDPLGDTIDLAPLFELLADENVLKVFHAARQDLEIFFRLQGRLPAPVFDTQVAAMVLGFGDSIGFENLIAKTTGASVDKGARFTDWSLRPLAQRQIEYALADVVLLAPAYDKLAEQLETSGRAAWIAEEMKVLLAEETYAPNPNEAWRRIKSKGGKPRSLAVLRELAAWRELEAQRRDVPKNRVLRDESLVEISHHRPKNVKDLARTRGLGQKAAEGRMGESILAAVRRGEDVPDADTPNLPDRADLPRGIGPTTDLLKLLLKMRCSEVDVAQKLVASSDDVERIAAFGEDADVPALKSWRREIFGEDALRVRNGEIGIGVKNRKLKLFDARTGEESAGS